MSTEFWDFWSAYGGYALALAGILLTLRPEVAKGRLAWVAWLIGFAVLGFLNARGTQVSQDRLESKITGGDSFLTFSVSDDALAAEKGTFPLVVIGGSYPLYDVSYTLFSIDESKSFSQQGYDQEHPIATARLGTVLPGIMFTGIRLPHGVYGVQVFARNGFSYERLEIPVSGSKGQQYAVHKPPKAEAVACQPATYSWCKK